LVTAGNSDEIVLLLSTSSASPTREFEGLPLATLSLFHLATHRSCITSKHTQRERPGFVVEGELRASGARLLQDR